MIKSRVFSSGYSGNNDLRSDYLLINKPPPCEYIDPSNKNYPPPPPQKEKKLYFYLLYFYINYGFTLSVHYPKG